MLSASQWRKMLRRTTDLHRGLLCVILALCGLGLMMQYSAAGGHWKPFAFAQAVRILFGMGLMIGIAILPPQRLLRSSYAAYGVCLGLLVLVEIMGVMGMGAQRWIGLGGLNLQPSELMKLGIILALARYFQTVRMEGGVRHWMLLIPPIFMTLLPMGLILHQPNLGTATIVALIAFALCFMAGIHRKYFVTAIGLVVAAVPIAYQFLHDYQKRRVLTFLNPDADPLGAGYNIIQSKIAIGSGGFWGKGWLHGSQGQLDFLPEKQTDFIFTMLAEELGFAGALVLLLFYAYLLLVSLILAVHCRSTYTRLIAAGIAMLFFVHIFINMAMVMGMIPVVGVPLPFLSYGGSFMLTALMACGLLLHAHLHRDTQLPRHGAGW